MFVGVRTDGLRKLSYHLLEGGKEALVGVATLKLKLQHQTHETLQQHDFFVAVPAI